MEAKLRCILTPGQFSSELVAVIQAANGREYSLFAQKSDLEFENEPTGEQPVSGWLAVEIAEKQGSLCLVKLPQSTLENGPFVTVLANQLDKVPTEQRAVAQ